MFIHSPPTSMIVVFAYHPHSLQLHAETEKAGNAIFLFLHGEEFDPLNLVQR